ncbi:inclusion membrane protein [Chlamydia felis Fe/C-56]|uniref:Inclusion membrane protein n=1 Tax=Chlamydia felis (strain Fe/C-56) TaxID=264202 RepID=Q254K0_CHLFF|nr:inclusion membrane protein IncB [Chlamydia felis]BAE81288.1 inclusion membrane protein [Chlamydia felis Fe/C-56]
MSTPLSSSNQPQDSEGLNRVLLSFDGRISKLEKQVRQFEEKVNQIEKNSSLSLTTGNNVATDMVHLKDKIGELEESLAAVVQLTIQSALERTSESESTSNSASSGYVIGRAKPSPCAKLTAIALTILALIAITMLIICVIAVCGGFPLFISVLNMYTVGACISLPIISCASVSIMILCSLSITSLLKNRLAIYKANLA